jgi:alpha-glucoside transport system permease protein
MRPVTTAGNTAYGFAGFRFPSRSALFFTVPTIRAVPLQAALTPVLQASLHLGVNGTFPGIWLAPTGFVLPLAWYLLV